MSTGAGEGTVAATDRNGHTAATTTTNAPGRYTLEVTPGEYTLRVTVDEPFPSCPNTTVTATSALLTTLDVDCDTGIR